MPNKPRNIFPNNIYHIYNRATEKRTIFYTEKDYNRFLEKIFYYKHVTNVRILAYSVMPNHFHLLLEEPDPSTFEVGHLEGAIQKMPIISKFISLLINSYTKYFNNSKDHSGRLFQGPFKSKLIMDNAYFQSIIAYINLNPIKHKLVKNINDWIYTSHHEFIKEVNKKLIDNSAFINKNDYKKIIEQNINKIEKINLDFD